MDELVDRELLDLRGRLHLDARSRHSFRDPGLERVEIGPCLPEVDDAPASVDRAGGVEQQARRRRPIRIDVIVPTVELFLRHPRELDADANCQNDSFVRWRDGATLRQ